MAYTVTLYTLTKRKNSTKNSGASGAVTCNCTLIDDTDLMNPIFKLELGINPINKNYCIIQDFGRKYFIEKVRSFQGFWYIECECDVLGTYKTQIGAQTFYVLRSASEYDEYISDSMYPAKSKMSGDHTESGSVMAWGTQHSYIVGITGYSQDILTAQTGSVTYYQMNDAALYNFIYYLMHDISQWCDIQAQGYDDPGVQEALINPIQYVVSCMGLPIAMQSGWTTANRIDFGYYTWNMSGPASGASTKIVPRAATITESADITIHKHPQASTRGAYLNAQPFSDYTFHCGPWGDIPVDPAALIDAEKLHYEILYDVCQGGGRLQVSPYASSVTWPNILYSGYAQVGVPIQLSQAIINPYLSSMQYERDYNAAVGSALGTASSAISLNISGLADYQTNTVQTIYDATVNKYPSVQSSGSNGSMLSFVDQYKCFLNHHWYTVVDENLTELGRPLYQNKRLNTLSGYILCQGADININCTKAEGEKINQYLNSGFFYE
mgnify:CR=1 FL=1